MTVQHFIGDIRPGKQPAPPHPAFQEAGTEQLRKLRQISVLKESSACVTCFWWCVTAFLLFGPAAATRLVPMGTEVPRMIVLRKLRKLAYEARWRTTHFRTDLKFGNWEERGRHTLKSWRRVSRSCSVGWPRRCFESLKRNETNKCGRVSCARIDGGA